MAGLDVPRRRDHPGGAKTHATVGVYPEHGQAGTGIGLGKAALHKAMVSAGLRPIPQYSVDQYDLDFALVVGDRRLDIEVDGERYHRSWTGELCLRDQLRNQRLIELGSEVKRFWVYEVRDQLDECVRKLCDWVSSVQGTESVFPQTGETSNEEISR